MPRLTDYRVLTFDCYGTLIDWECGIWDALQPLIMRNGDGRKPGHPGRRAPGLRAMREPAGTGHARPALPGAACPRASEHRREPGPGKQHGARRGVRRLRAALARVPGHRRCAARSQAPLQARRPVQRAPRRHRRVEPQAGCRVRRHLHCRGHRLLQAVGHQLRVPAWRT